MIKNDDLITQAWAQMLSYYMPLFMCEKVVSVNTSKLENKIEISFDDILNGTCNIK